MPTQFCKICNATSAPFATGRILNKYEIRYFRCEECGLVQTEEPYWLAESYTEAIHASDLGLVTRSVSLSWTSEVIISTLFNPGGRFVDYGGGYGIYVRLMRDAGFDFRRYDKYCENLFAQGFDITPEDQCEFELLTAFEVLEHLPDPGKELGRMLQMTSNIFFSTVLIPFHDPPRPGDWWYYGMDHGQHIAFYTRESFARLAKRSELHFYSTGTLHLLTKKRIPEALFRLLCDGRVSRLVELLLPNRRPLLESDFQRLTRDGLTRLKRDSLTAPYERSI